MAAMQCHKTTEKGLNQGYYGGSCNAAKNQGPQNGYAAAYSESERYGLIHYPNHGMSECQTAYGMAEFHDEYGRSYGNHKSQNGNAMSKTKVHSHGNGFGGHGMAQIQAYGSSNHSSPGRRQNCGYGYGYGSNHGNQKNSGIGQGFSNRTNYEITEAYAHEGFETNGWENGMAQSPAHRRGKHSGQGIGFIKTQPHGPGKNMGYEITETETCLYSQTETQYSNESRYYGGARGYHAGNGMDCHGKTKNMGDHSVRGLLRKMKDGISGKSSCSRHCSESDDDECERRKVWISKAL